MDKKGYIEKHSQEKLLVYQQYLIGYLSVLTNLRYFKRIFIWDVFAGKGKDEKGVKGSALIAAQVIKDFRDRKKKDIQLVLNELDEENYNHLNNLIDENGFQEFTEVYKEKADHFLQKVSQELNEFQGIHNLFFIDPHGYTQYSTNTLKILFDLSSSEYLIFIPTKHIYRFIHPRKEEPAVRFLLDLGVKEDSLKDIKTLDDLVVLLENALKKFANTQFVYSYKLEKKGESGGFFHLLFITKHIKGAQKFLEAEDKIRASLTEQLFLFSDKESKLEDLLKNFLKTVKTNEQVFEFSIQKGFLPKEVNRILKSWEHTKNLEIVFADKGRRKGYFYLKDNPEKTIYLKKKNEQN